MGARDHVLTVEGHVDLSDSISAYCDADHANSPGRGLGRSISGYTIPLGCGAVAWSAKKQTATTWSTPETEYYASVRAGQEVARLRHPLTEIGFLSGRATTPNIDNTSAIHPA